MNKKLDSNTRIYIYTNTHINEYVCNYELEQEKQTNKKKSTG